MGSVIDYYRHCPVCGHNAVMAEYWYKRDELAEFCMACGYSHNVELIRDSGGELTYFLSQTYDLEKDFVFLGKIGVKHLGPAMALEEFVSVERVTGDMSTAQLLAAWKYDGDFVTQIYLRGADSRITWIVDGFCTAEIRMGKLLVYRVDWEEKTDGGYGIMRIGGDGITGIYSLSKGSTIKSVLSSLDDEAKTHLKEIVVFSPRGKNPQFYNTTEEKYFQEYDEPGKDAPGGENE